MVKLISLDLDGTLLTPGGRITAASKAAIARARAAGVRVVVNTGRDCHEAAWFAREAGCDTLNASTGGALVSDGEMVIRRWEVPEPAARRALELVQSWEGIVLLIFAGEQSLIRQIDKAYMDKNYPFPAFHKNVVVTSDPIAYMAEHQLPLCKIHGELDPSRYPIDQLRAIDGVFVTTSSPHDFELIPAGVDKGRALAVIAAWYGITLEQCAAVGDSDNDLEALKAVGLPIAMGNAPRNVKDAAARVAPSNEEEGAAWAILSCLEN